MRSLPANAHTSISRVWQGISVGVEGEESEDLDELQVTTGERGPGFPCFPGFIPKASENNKVKEEDIEYNNNNKEKHGKPGQPGPKEDVTLPSGQRVTMSEAIHIWRCRGAPIIHLGPGENCFSLSKLLSQEYIRPEHLEAIATWLEEESDREV